MKLIDKDALVAEIEKFKADALQKKSQCKRHGLEKIMHQIGAYNKMLSFIDTIEVKEVELTWKDVREICTQSVLVEIDLGCLVSDERHYTEVLKRFKAQKGG